MLKTQYKFNKIEFDVKKFRKDLDFHIFELLKGAIQAFVNTMYPKVPVYTGMARASIGPLADVVNIQIPISPKVTGPWATTRLLLGPSMGAQGTTLKDYVEVRRNQYGPFRYDFTWFTGVPHWQFLEEETHPKVKSAPWWAITRGNEAMEKYINLNVEKILPEMDDYIFVGAL